MDEKRINEAFFASLSSKASCNKIVRKSKDTIRKKKQPERNKYSTSTNVYPYNDIVKQQRFLFFGMSFLCVILLIKLART
jgi:hypothetical protein